MEKIKSWFNQNVDKKQMTTLIVTGVVVGAGVYGLRKAGFGKVATVVKGG
jgi:rhodanese-related sulfurtransferase